MNPRVRHKVPRSLICNEAYEVGFTKHNRAYFNARPLDPNGFDPARDPTNPADNFEWAANATIIPIPLNWNPLTPIVLADPRRNLLVIQNNSVGNSAGGDVLPTLVVGLDGPVSLAGGAATNPLTMNFPAGLGLVLDERVPTNAIYVAWGSSTRVTAAFNAGAYLMYGRTLNATPKR